MKTLIYCRVSRKDQNYQRQISDQKAIASSKGWEVIDIISEKISGAKTTRAGNGNSRIVFSTSIECIYTYYQPEFKRETHEDSLMISSFWTR